MGRPERAVDLLRPGMADLARSLHHNLPIYVALVHQTESAAAAAAELTRLEHLSSTRGYPLAALIAGADHRAAAEGVESYAAAGAPAWDIGFLRLHVGRRLQQAGDREPARAQFDSALERFALIGATPWIERAEAALREVGAPVRRRTDRDETLTPGEHRIADLVAEGNTNKEVAAQLFLSPKTVEFHLSSAYRKLGVTNRTALARRLTPEGTPRGP